MKKLAVALGMAFVLLAGPVAEANGGHHGGGHYRSSHHHGGYYHGGYGWGGVAVYPRVFIGGPYWWGGSYPYYRYPYYSYPYYPYSYYPRPIIIERSEPQVYVQQPQPEPQYWYYCENPKGYYPSVNKCRSEWLQVVPRSDSPDE